MRRFGPLNMTALALGLAFLYLPIAILVINSFNDSRLVTVWGGASLRWYRALINDDAMLEAASVSLRVAFLSATVATVLGTLAALALTRGGRFHGRVLFSGMIYAPLVMPEVITGLSLLLLFVALDIDRGFWTITIAHTTLTLCFVAVVVQSRLVTFDRSLEEAAMDLGCPPWRAFFTVTVPLSLPGIVAGCLLCFIPITGEFVIPDLLGSSTTSMIGQTLWLEFFGNRDWPVASALAVVLLALLVTPITIYRRREARQLERGR